MNAPAISVLLLIHNAEDQLALAFDSILHQTFTDFELIGIDNGSTDRSREMLEAYARKDIRIRCFFREPTSVGCALNDGVSVARGEFLAMMDARDVARPYRFAHQLERLRGDPELVAVGSDVVMMDDSGNLVKSCTRPSHHSDIEETLLTGDGSALVHSASMSRRAAVIEVGGYRGDGVDEDLDHYLRLSRVGRLANLPEPLLHYRIDPANPHLSRFANGEKKRTHILQAAHDSRGLAYIAQSIYSSVNSSNDMGATHYREWSTSSLAFGSRRVAIKHGLNACLAQPMEPKSWKALHLALTSPIPAAGRVTDLSIQHAA